MNRAEIKTKIHAMQPGETLEFDAYPTNPAYVRQLCAGRGLSVHVTPTTITVKTAEPRTSFAARLREQLETYAAPLFFEGQSETYLRAIVSAYNVANQKSFTVQRTNGGHFVYDRSDYQNTILTTPVATIEDTPTPDELLKRAVELMRTAGLGGDEMRFKLNQYITDNDDLL